MRPGIPRLGEAVDRPLSILAFVHRYPPEHNAGAEWMLHSFLAWLVKRGHKAHVMANVGPAVLDGVTMGPPEARGWAEADVAITHLDRTRQAIQIAKRYRTPLVHVVHNDAQLHYFRVRPVESTLVVYNSEWIAASYPAFRGPSIVCRPPVLADQYRVENHRGKAITLVNCMAAKGVLTFYELAERMPDLRFLGVWGAYGPQVPAPELENLRVIAQTPNIRDDVYARTATILMPSSYESWGRVAIEACASGIPVIAHPTPGLLEALDYAGTFVDRDDIAGWERAIRRTLDTEYRKPLRRNARERSAYLDKVARADLEAFEVGLLRAVGGR